MSNGPETVFRFAAEGVDLEFAGSEDFVEKQLARFQSFLRSAVGAPGGESTHAHPAAVSTASPATGAAASPAPATLPHETLPEFFAARPMREGRGAIQDRILLFVYYLQRVQGKREVAGEDIVWCFQQLGILEPKNLHNALGILKRKIIRTCRWATSC